MVITLIARIAGESGRFDMGSLARGVGDKLIRRHPHVSGEAEETSSERVVENWERIKKSEREERAEDSSALAGVPVSLPALQRIEQQTVDLQLQSELPLRMPAQDCSREDRPPAVRRRSS